MLLSPPTSTLFPYTTLFRSEGTQQPDLIVTSETNQRLDQRDDRHRDHPAAPRAHRGARIGHHEEDEQLIHRSRDRSEEHTSELQSRRDLVCRLLLEKKNRYD